MTLIKLNTDRPKSTYWRRVAESNHYEFFDVNEIDNEPSGNSTNTLAKSKIDGKWYRVEGFSKWDCVDPWELAFK